MQDTSQPNDSRDPTATSRPDDYSLHEVEQHFAELVAGVEDHAIFLLDPNGIVKSWNAGAHRIKGYEAGRDHRTVVHAILSAGCDRPRLAARRAEARRRNWAVSGRRLAPAEGRIADLGERRHHRICEPPQGELRGFLKITRDLDRTQAGGRDAAPKRRTPPADDRERPGLRHLHARSGRPYRDLELGRRANQGIHAPRRLSASIFRFSIRRKTLPPASRSASWKSPSARVALKMKAGEFARTGRNSGRTSSSRHCTTATARCEDSPRLPAT